MFTKLKFSIPAVVAAALLAATPIAATAQLKIGVVDMSRLRDEAPQGQAAAQVLESEFADRQRVLLTEQTTIARLQAGLQQETTTTNPALKAKRESDLRIRQRDLQRNRQDYEIDLNRRRNEEIERLHGLLLKEIQTFAREEGFDVVLTEMAYYSAQIDVTERVLQRLRKTGGDRP